MDDLYLSHHGILGQKWGVRRFQNTDGSLTDAGRKRYSVDIETAQKNYDSAKNTYRAMYKYGSGKAIEKSNLEAKYARQDLLSEKIKNRINKKGGLTKTQEKYQKEYMKKGMTEEEAAVAAYKKDITRKALIAGAAVAVTAIGAYAGYRYGQYACDSVLKKGTLLSRVSSSDSKGVHDAFYAVLDKNATDKARYEGIFPGHLKALGADKVFEKSIQARDDLKIASPKNAAEIMRRSLDSVVGQGDTKQMKALRGQLRQHAAIDRIIGATDRANLYERGIKELDRYEKTGKVGRSLYETLNSQLADYTSPLNTRFYSELKKAGYQGVKDVNDSKYSGYMTKLPLIIADAGKVKVSSVRQLHTPEIREAERIANNANIGKILVQNLPRHAAALTAPIAAVSLANKRSTDLKNDKIVDQYRKDHPNTELSYNDIVRMYEREQVGAK